MRALLAAILLLLSSPAFTRGGGGGHNVTFDPNSYGGGWKNIITDYSATCNGTGTNDNTAFTNAAAAGVAANPALFKLYIPPGSNCKVSNTDYFKGITNLIIWRYGSTIDFAQIGSLATFYQDTVHNAFIQSASAGATTVTLVTAAENSRFSVGDWICVNALTMQSGGFPPNWNFFEYRLITAINAGTGVITLNSPLTYSYSSTYPQWTGLTSDGGPANISKMKPEWNINQTWFGGTITGPACLGISGRNIAIYDTIWVNNPCPEAADNMSFFWSTLGANDVVEVDKEINNFNFFRSTAASLKFQSSSVNNTLIESSTLPNNPSLFGLNGTPTNLTVRNSNLTTSVNSSIQMNPVSYGHTVNVVADGSTITSLSTAHRSILASWFTFSAGTLVIANTDPNLFHVFEFVVPGQKYYTGGNDGTPCSAKTTFTVTGLTQDASNTNVITDLVSLPTCNISPMSYNPYQAATVIQKFSGPADLTQFAAP